MFQEGLFIYSFFLWNSTNKKKIEGQETDNDYHYTTQLSCQFGK